MKSHAYHFFTFLGTFVIVFFALIFFSAGSYFLKDNIKEQPIVEGAATIKNEAVINKNKKTEKLTVSKENVKKINKYSTNNFNKKNNKSTKGFFSSDSLNFNADAPEKKEGWKNPYTHAHSAVAIDVQTGTILYNQKATQQKPIASLTKMMTAIVVMESLENFNEAVVTIDRETISTGGSKVGCPSSTYCDSNKLKLGEKVLAKDLFESMLIASTNDAAVALARHIAGSEEKFAQLMNQKAGELNLKNTHFCNPTGLDIDGMKGKCYSSAYDLARISAYSMRYQPIWKALRKKEKTFYSIDKTLDHTVKNTNHLLEKMPNCEGAKTGFTYEAGKSLMTAAHAPDNKKHKVIAVVLDDIYRWQDMPELLNWCFEAYKWK